MDLSVFTSSYGSLVDTQINNILLIQQLSEYNNQALQMADIKMMTHHSWHISLEMATLAFSSPHLSSSEKSQFVI